jgi:hypothetical protein
MGGVGMVFLVVRRTPQSEKRLVVFWSFLSATLLSNLIA